MKRIFAVAVFAVLAVSFLPSPAWAQGCDQSCDGLTSLPPQDPPARSFDDFIQQAYLGAYGRPATCDERAFEFSALSSAASNGLLLAEAQRFVATLFETETSYDDGGSPYTQTAEYEALNSNSYTDRAHLQAFVTDLYEAFLQRSPDDGGLCFWTNQACTDPGHRRHVIQAFVVSIEFSNLVSHLFVGTAPSCGFGGGGGGGDCGGGRIGQIC
jgi:hypothetical protein